MADDRNSIDLQHAEEVSHAVGVGGYRVVGPRLFRSAMSEQIGRHDGVRTSQLIQYRSPGVRTVPDPMDQEQGGALPAGDEGPPRAVDRAELDRVPALVATARPEP